MFKLVIDRAKHRLILNIDGFLDIDLMFASEREMRAGVAAILRDRQDFDLLVCLNNLGPASREASGRLGDLFNDILNDLRKAAYVGLGSLAVLQMRRVTKNDQRFKFFDDRDVAEAWLDK